MVENVRKAQGFRWAIPTQKNDDDLSGLPVPKVSILGESRPFKVVVWCTKKSKKIIKVVDFDSMMRFKF